MGRNGDWGLGLLLPMHWSPRWPSCWLLTHPAGWLHPSLPLSWRTQTAASGVAEATQQHSFTSGRPGRHGSFSALSEHPRLDPSWHNQIPNSIPGRRSLAHLQVFSLECVFLLKLSQAEWGEGFWEISAVVQGKNNPAVELQPNNHVLLSIVINHLFSHETERGHRILESQRDLCWKGPSLASQSDIPHSSPPRHNVTSDFWCPFYTWFI